MLEIEVKIKIGDLEEVRRKLAGMGAELFRERHYENNTLYDFRDQLLYSKQFALRVREKNKKGFLTFKGAKQGSRKFKIREEYETEVKNVKQLRKILQSLGLVPVFQYQKHRTVYRYKKLLICLDETAAGNFLELEGDQSDIVRFATALGYSKQDFIKDDYIQMITKIRDKIGEEKA
jgi:adenylate cyclase class 2